ncbi:hypothetical protein EDC04DRAFT_2929361 [Pisolithus marmoratus]|nr:hypothetical protein EDC04DRAFT_2929361 [Pisolithus marmoratus]
MPKIAYLLIQQISSKVYEIRDPIITHDIPNIGEVQELLDHASASALGCLDSTQLLDPVCDWHCLPYYDIANELGTIDKDFFKRRVAFLPAGLTLSFLEVDVYKLQILVLFIDDVNLVETWMTNRLRVDIPPVEQLHELVERPLAEPEKIPIPETMLEALVSIYDGQRCTTDAAHSLFKVGEFDVNLLDAYDAVFKSAPDSGTEYSFISFWDYNISRILQMVVPNGHATRNNNQFTSILLYRPDFAFLLKQVCPFRGEEKGPDVVNDPREELIEKCIWIYDPAPYMLGYYCVGTEMTLAAITAPQAPGQKPGCHDIINVDLKLREDRIANVRHLINLSPLLPLLANLVPPHVYDFLEVKRPTSRITLNPMQVIKSYQCENADQMVNHLKEIYSILKRNFIPNTDKLVHAHETIVVLEPRGISREPSNERELRECLVCILHTLVDLHQIPLYHCDIQWSNVVRKIDDESKWLLINWENATTPPTKAQMTFTEEDHSPAIFQDGYGEEVGIWAVGYLIQTCATPDISVQLWKLGEHVCEGSAKLRAKDVLMLLDNTLD